VRNTVLSALALTALLTVAATAPAQEAKPVVVVSFAGYQRLMDDISYLGKLTNKPGAAQQVEGLLQFFTQGQGLAGLDKARPWGAVATVTLGASGPEPSVVAFVPVTDLDRLMQSLAAVQPQKMDDGTWKIQNEQATMYVRAQGNWAYLGQSAEVLANLPADPMQLLGGLEAKYDVAVQVHPRNVPQELRQMLIEQLRAKAAELERNDGEDQAAFETRKRLTEQQFEALTKQIDDVQQVTVGVSVDSEAQKLFVDVDVTPVPGSSTAAQLAAQQGLKTSFGGFLVPEAPVTLGLRQHLGQDEIDQALIGIEAGRPSLLKEIEESEDLSDEEKGIAKNIANQLMDVVAATLKTGEVDTMLSVVGDGPLALIFATNVANPAELEKAVKSLADAAARDANFSQLKVNADQHKNVRFHTMEITLPEWFPAPAAKLVGDPVPVVVGIGERSAYLGIGVDVLGMLKQAIDRSATSTAASAGPFGLTVTVAPILKAIAEAAPNNPVPAMLAGQLQGGNDHVRVTVSQADGKQRVRIEVEEGLIKLIGAAAPAPAAGNNF